MISTHSLKLVKPRAKQAGLVSYLPPAFDSFICSATQPVEQVYWPHPNNAADFKRARAEQRALDPDKQLPEYLPDVIDAHNPQIFLPLAHDHYVLASPAPSCGVLDELNRRLKHTTDEHLTQRIVKWQIESVAASLANRGELAVRYRGILRVIADAHSRTSNAEPLNLRSTDLVITFQAASMNLSSGLVSVGLPAITAVAGAVHTLERFVGLDNTPWAVGFKDMTWQKRPRTAVRDLLRDKNKMGQPMLINHELVGSGNIALIVRMPDARSKQVLMEAVEKKFHRFAGGSVLNLEPGNTSNLQTYAFFQSTPWRSADAKAPLDEVLNLVSSDNNNHLTVVGFGFLGAPTFERVGKRSEELAHVWAENLYAPLTLGALNDRAFFSRHTIPYNGRSVGVHWRG